MNAKQIFAAAALAVIGASALASEATPYVAEAGSLTRAEVKAELLRAQAAGELPRAGDPYGSFESLAYVAGKASSANLARSRDAVRAAPHATARGPLFDSPHVGG